MLLRLLPVLLALLPATVAAAPTRILEIRRADDSVVSVEVYDRGRGAEDRALLIVQGSTCETTDGLSWFDQVLQGASVRWVAIVAKDGASRGGACGPAYEAHAIEEARWFDHLLAARRLKDELHLKDSGALQVLAVSAGGLTACALAGASTDVGSVALLSTGGGLTFDQEFDLLTRRDPAFAEQRMRLRTDPRLGKTWMGRTNPEIWWWSVLSKRCLPLLDRYRGSVLVVHGNRDTSTPVESARALARALGPRATYIELETEHDLGLSRLPAADTGLGVALKWLRSR